MTTTLLCAIVLAGLFVGANIGANDAANCLGTALGAGLLRFRTGIVLVAVCVVAGALLQGDRVAQTIGKGIVTQPIEPAGALAALLCGGAFVAIATFRKIPVSTSQSVVGAVAGVGLAARLEVDFSTTLDIVGSWVICPILSGVLTYLLYRIILAFLRRKGKSERARSALRWLVLFTVAYAAYSLGANHLGNAIGPILMLEIDILDAGLLAVLGALSIAAGALFFGRGVAETVGRSIIPLDLAGATAVQLSTAFGLHLFSMLGVPVSSSQAIVGALLGVGLYHGIKTVSRRKLLEIVAGWVLVPTAAGVVSYAIYRLILAL